MKTTLDVVDILYNRLLVGGIVSVSGGIYKQTRPIGSTVEDVVVNSLPITNTQLQQCIANVNVFVPDKKVTVNGIGDNMADTARLNTLAKIIINLLDDVWTDDYHFWVQQQTLLNDEESKQHYLNIRIEFYSIKS